MAHHAAIRSEWVGPSSWTTWAPTTHYGLGAYVIPIAATGYYYKCTTAGTTAGAPPVFPTVTGNTVADGGVVWTCMYTTALLPSELAALDAYLAAGVNGVDGGCYAPAGQVVLAGSGLQLSGPLVVARGGQLTSKTGLMQFAAGSFPLLGPTHAGRTRSVVYPFLDARPSPNALWRPRRDSSGMQAVAPQFTSWQQPGVVQTAGLSMRIRGMQGATISQVTVVVRVPTPHPGLPKIMPGARLLRVDAGGNAVVCTSIASGADANGFVYAPRPSSGAAWTNGGLAQTFVLPVDQNNVVDRTQYHYRLEVLDEQGLTGWPWQVSLLQPCRCLQVPSSPSTFQSWSLNCNDLTAPIHTGDRVLVVGSQGNSETGIFLAKTTDWVRAADVITQGCVTGIQQGQVYGGTYWQASPSVASFSAGTTPPGAIGGLGLQGFWVAGAGWNLGQAILPLTYSGFWYACTTAGTAGATEPSWPTSPGQVVVDGSIVWTCGGPAATALPWVTRPDADSVAFGLGLNGYGTIFEAAVVEYTGITQNGWQ